MNIIQIGMAVGVLIALAWFSWKKPRLSSIIVWSLVATVLLTSSALVIIPGKFSIKANWLSLSFPITWAVFQYLCYWADNQWKVMWSLIVISLVSAAILLSMDVVV